VNERVENDPFDIVYFGESTFGQSIELVGYWQREDESTRKKN